MSYYQIKMLRNGADIEMLFLQIVNLMMKILRKMNWSYQRKTMILEIKELISYKKLLKKLLLDMTKIIKLISFIKLRIKWLKNWKMRKKQNQRIKIFKLIILIVKIQFKYFLLWMIKKLGINQ